MRSGLAAIPTLGLAALLAALPACEDSFGPGAASVATDTITLAAPGSASSATLGSAVDLLGINAIRFPERLTDAGQWDFALRLSGGSFSLLPFSTPTGGSSVRAGAFRSTDAFDAIRTAPTRRSAYTLTVDPFPIAEGQVYVARSRLGAGPFNSACNRYARFRILELDEAAGTARIAIATNTECNDDRLVAED